MFVYQSTCFNSQQTANTKNQLKFQANVNIGGEEIEREREIESRYRENQSDL